MINWLIKKYKKWKEDAPIRELNRLHYLFSEQGMSDQEFALLCVKSMRKGDKR